MKVRTMTVIATGLALVILISSTPAQEKQQAPIKIGVAGSLFRDLSEAKTETLIPDFEGLFLEHTGLKGEIIKAGDATDVGKKLNDKTVQLGVLNGFEFAWARQSFPELRPLVIAAQRQKNLKAFVVVLNESKAASLADLKGKVLSIPSGTPEQCHLFLERELAAMKVDPKTFFAKVELHPNSEDALDDVLRNKVQAVLVDGISLDTYEQVNPGRYARLKMLKQAEGFPPAVMAYRTGGFDDATLAQLKKGLLNAKNTVKGKEQLAQWKLTGFEEVPNEFEGMVVDILKRYPPEKKN